MATTTNLTTTYAGQAAAGYISAAFLSGKTLENGGVTIKPNVKHKEVIKTLSTDGLLKDGSCDFDPTSTITLAEKILEVKDLQVNLEVCKTPFRSDWEAASMGASAHDNLPSDFVDYLISYQAAKVAEAVETNIWSGAVGTTGEFDGFEVLATADATVVDVVGTTVTAANVIAELDKVVAAIPDSVYGKEDLNIYIPTGVAKAYVAAQAALGYRDLYNVGMTDMNYQGINLFHAPGMTANYIFAAQSSNLFFGTSLMSDLNEVKVLDMSDLDGSQNVRFIMRAAAAVQIGIGADCVLYTPA